MHEQLERELAELEAALGPDVRATRPAPDPDWARHMDNLMERGFRSPEPPSRDRANAGRRWWELLFTGPAVGIGLAALLVAVVIVLPGGDSSEEGSGGGGMAATTSEESASQESARQSTAGSAAAGGATSEDSAASTAAPDAGLAVPPAPAQGSPGSDGRARRQVERSASITLATRPRNVDAVSARVQEVARAQGGFVVSSSVASSRSGGGGQFELRVPTRNLDATMAALARLGAVRDRAQRSEDITAQAVSAADRLQDARAERTSLLRQLEDATTLTAASALRERLRIVSGEIEAARADVRRVRNRATYATVAVTLVADAAAAPAGQEEDDGVWSPGDAARDALRVLEVIAGVLLIALAVLVPLAVLLGLAWLAARRGARRGRERALDAG